jgi:cytochrome o ubiquinol oxidase subunit 1
MAVIETPPETVAAAAEAPGATRVEPTGLAAILGSGDHKVIGRLYIGFSLVFAAALLALGVAVGVERIDPDKLQVFTSDTAFQYLTMYRFGLVFLVALPLVIGVATVVVPLQVGAKAIAFPRAAAASFWGWLFGAALFLLAYGLNGGPGGGRARGVYLWIASLGLLTTSVLLAAVCLATTVLALRQTGMSTDTVPLFSWSVLVASILWLLTLPVVLAVVVLVYVDNRHSGLTIGANAGIYDRFLWVLRNPQIYVVAIPVLGFAADVIATTAKVRVKPRAAAAGAIAAFGVFGFGAFLAGANADDQKAWVVIALGVAAVLPVLATLGLVGDLLRRGTVRITGGALYAIAALLVLLLTVVAGAVAAIPRFEVFGTTTDFAVSHGAVLAAVIAALGGIHWWATKIGRNPASEALGRLAPLVLLLGGAAAVIGDVANGFATKDKTAIAATSSYAGGVAALNVVVTVGIVLALLGVLAAVASYLPLLKANNGQVARDPWDGQTLEWLTTSPPPLTNFDQELPIVTSAEPLTDLREEQ